jgi:hypothetical protein
VVDPLDNGQQHKEVSEFLEAHHRVVYGYDFHVVFPAQQEEVVRCVFALVKLACANLRKGCRSNCVHIRK